MNQRRLALPLHCFLFGLIPFTSQLAFNMSQFLPSEALRSAIVVLVMTAVALVALRLLVDDLVLASLLLSTASILFFAYGHLFTVLLLILDAVSSALGLGLEGLGIVLASHLILVLGLPSLLAAMRVLLRRKQGWWIPSGVFLNAVGIFALLIPAYQILEYQWGAQRSLTANRPEAERTTLPTSALTGSAKPDIYYFVLDGYAREDVLRQGYDHDNSDFLSFLEDHGFWVADRSRSNYVITALSQASTLNMSYLDDLLLGDDPEASYPDGVGSLAPLIRESRVRRIVEQRGYRFISFNSGYGLTEVADADVYLVPDYQGIGAFESLIIRTSALSLVEDGASLLGFPYPYSGYGSHRERLRFALETLPQVAEMEGPKFVYIHMLIPHPPFVFDRAGNPVEPQYRYTLHDASSIPLSDAQYVEGYREQVIFINSGLTALLPELIEESEASPVILIQGDHGPGARLDWAHPTPRGMKERAAILNALRIPGSDYESFYPTISPVNSFRLVFNELFGGELEILSDRAYFSAKPHPFDFQRIP